MLDVRFRLGAHCMRWEQLSHIFLVCSWVSWWSRWHQHIVVASRSTFAVPGVFEGGNSDGLLGWT